MNELYKDYEWENEYFKYMIGCKDIWGEINWKGIDMFVRKMFQKQYKRIYASVEEM